MVAKKKAVSKTPPKRKTKSAKIKETVNLDQIFSAMLDDQPLGKALAALDKLYDNLDDMEIRLNILISRISILKKRTASLKKGEVIGLNQPFSNVYDFKRNVKQALEKGQSDTEGINGKVEWQKLRLLEETTINDVLLAPNTEVSIELNAAKTLLENGVAEVIHTSDKDEQNEETPEDHEETMIEDKPKKKK